MGRSKEARKRRHDKRMARRRAIKATKRAEYEAKIRAGRNRKPKQSFTATATLNLPRELRLVPVVRYGKVVWEKRSVHGGQACGNIGCRRCFPHLVKAA